MAERFFSESDSDAARGRFVVQFAREFDAKLGGFLHDATHTVFPRLVEAAVPRAAGAAAFTFAGTEDAGGHWRTFPWRISRRTTHRHELLAQLGAAFWEDLVAGERLAFLWALRDYTPSTPDETDVFVPVTLPWGTRSEPELRGWEKTEWQGALLSAAGSLKDDDDDDDDSWERAELRRRVLNGHAAAAIVGRLEAPSPALLRAAWRALWIRDVYARSVRVICDERDRFPETTGAFYDELLQKHRAWWALANNTVEEAGGAYQAAYANALRNSAHSMARAIVSAASLLCGYPHDLPASGEAGERLLPDRALAAGDHMEVWVMLGRYPALVFRSGVVRAVRDDPASAHYRALRLVRYALAPRVWPKGDQADYHQLVADATNELRALQRKDAFDGAEWTHVQELFMRLCEGLLAVEPDSCVYVRWRGEAWRTPLLSYCAFQIFTPLLPVPAAVYDANAVDERQAWAAAHAPLAPVDSLYDYRAYDADQAARAAHEETLRHLRLNPPQQHQEMIPTPSPRSLESDEEAPAILDNHSRAWRAVERSKRGVRDGGPADRSVFPRAENH